MTWVLVLLLGVLAIPLMIEVTRTPMSPKKQEQAPGQFADLSQGRTHFEWFGPERGPVAVCVHGLTTSSYVWYTVARALALMGFRVLVYDHFGRGYSDTVSGKQDAAFFVQHLNDLLAHEHVDEPFTLLGYSMGGAVVAHFAACHPKRIKRLVLIAPAGMHEIMGRASRICREVPVVGDWLFLLIYPYQLRKGIRAEANLESSVESIGDRQDAETGRRGYFPSVLSSFRGVLRNPAEEQHKVIAEAGIPVLAVWGDLDELIPLSARDTLTGWNAAAHHAVVKNAGHSLPYTHADAVMGAYRAYFSKP